MLGGMWLIVKGDSTGQHLLTGTQELKEDLIANQGNKRDSQTGGIFVYRL